MKEEKGFFSDYKEQIQEALTDLKTKGRRHKQIPNILTLLRLTAPAVILPAALIGNIPFIIGATAIFGLTDLADGFIARNWKLTSKLGADLDALADKLFAGTLLLAASITNPALLVNVGLEMAIAGININQKAKGKEAASTMMGKVKTFALFPLAGAGILSSVLPPALINTLALTTTALQGLTIASYLSKYKKTNKVTEEQSEVKITNINNDQEVTIDKTEKEKALVKEKEQASQPVQETNKNLEQLREMRAFLLSEKRIAEPEKDNEKAPIQKSIK
ncbi:MAG: CDP-alcohol phosphatidyltransferase family protein [Bacilli bacterium]|nr:CDP-alcohol phosphatidyltransferase family protein [Bacilli bacterium]